jgi:transposase
MYTRWTQLSYDRGFYTNVRGMLVDMYHLRGMSLREMADEFGLSTTRPVARAMERYWVTRRPGGPRTGKNLQWFQTHSTEIVSMTSAEVAITLGITTNSALHYLRKLKLQYKRRWAPGGRKRLQP